MHKYRYARSHTHTQHLLGCAAAAAAATAAIPLTFVVRSQMNETCTNVHTRTIERNQPSDCIFHTEAKRSPHNMPIYTQLYHIVVGHFAGCFLFLICHRRLSSSVSVCAWNSLRLAIQFKKKKNLIANFHFVNSMQWQIGSYVCHFAHAFVCWRCLFVIVLVVFGIFIPMQFSMHIKSLCWILMRMYIQTFSMCNAIRPNFLPFLVRKSYLHTYGIVYAHNTHIHTNANQSRGSYFHT